MPTAMAKIATVFLVVVAVTAATGNGACTYRFDVKTGDQLFAGTDGFIDFGLYQDGLGWDGYTVDTKGQFYDRGHTDSFTVVSELCIDPCGLKIGFNQRILGLSSWYCVSVSVSVHGAVEHPKKEFKVERWFNIVLSTANINTCS